jgi:hypothetical protein
VRSRHLVAAFRDLFISSTNFFVNIRDLLIIFYPSNGININNRLLLPINRALGLGGGFLLFVILLVRLALLLTLLL